MARANGKDRTCIFDLEGNNLLPKLTNLWCAVAVDVNTEEVFQWTPDDIKQGVSFLEQCERLIGHNVVDYDCRALEKLYPGWQRPKVWDTLIMAKVIWPPDTLWGKDLKLAAQGRLPKKYVKRHSLAAWGYRLGNYKGDYTGGFDEWSQEMQDYMVQDGMVTLDLWRLIEDKAGWREAA